MVAGIQKNVVSGFCRKVKKLVEELDPRDVPKELCTPLLKHCVEEEWELAAERLISNPEEGENYVAALHFCIHVHPLPLRLLSLVAASDSFTGDFPLHVACKFDAPLSLLEQLMKDHSELFHVVTDLGVGDVHDNTSDCSVVMPGLPLTSYTVMNRRPSLLLAISPQPQQGLEEQ